jgi:HK97 gp10 family phage protein
MFSMNWEQFEGEVGAMMARFNALPRYIAKKHLVAAVKRAGREGVPILKRNTPVGGTRRVKSSIVRGETKQNFQRRGGALRRAATIKAAYKGRNADGFVYGVLGYKFGFESRKAIWLEFGTSRGIQPQRIIEKTMQQWKGPLQATLAKEMALAFEKAVKELESGMNPGMSRRGMAAGIGRR